MAQGLQVWDSNGKIQLDTTTQTTTFLTKLHITTPNNTTYYTNSALTEGTPFYIVTPMNTPHSRFIKVSITGDTATIITEPMHRDFALTAWDFQVYIGVF